MKKLITNGMVLTMNEAGDTYPDGYIMFEDGVITETGSMCEMPPERQQDGRLRMPPARLLCRVW